MIDRPIEPSLYCDMDLGLFLGLWPDNFAGGGGPTPPPAGGTFGGVLGQYGGGNMVLGAREDF